MAYSCAPILTWCASLLGATNIITVAASDGLRHRTVISERNDPSKQRLETPWEDLRPVLYPAADAVSANSHGALSSMRSYCPEGKLRHAPNPLILADGTHDTRSNALLFLARLVPQKAPDVLIEAFASFIRTAPGWKLHVAGDGPMAEELQMRVRALGLTDGVTFHGVVTDPTPLLTRCRIFVLPSRFEGTPNALLEAMGHRMACIVSDASPGPLRLIEHGVGGLVVETGSVEGLAGALGELSRDEQLQRKLGMPLVSGCGNSVWIASRRSGTVFCSRTNRPTPRSDDRLRGSVCDGESNPVHGRQGDRSVLRNLARHAPAGTSIVEVGTWLGAGTAQLALGIRERARPSEVALHCYDRWQANRSEITKAAGCGAAPRVRRRHAPSRSTYARAVWSAVRVSQR